MKWCSRRRGRRVQTGGEGGGAGQRYLEMVVEGLGAVLTVLEELLHSTLIVVRDGVVQRLPET
jgi:hypothetical protein